ncbi:hypothetical protein [Aquimarina litoralis]|uniref:hypothetical protein n=1 Tax=Aquimarina litoralis TaxID=584605 RepID=UPI001C581C0C|nr:hypothetical protein [Aquimarina litoralis]MBW1294529.1 hypothetical protein [Aquimarina litoralis]
MKYFNTHLRTFVLLLSVLFSSCVNDDSFFPEENTDNVTSSPALVTVLNNFGSDNAFISENEQCFRFVYPITLGYNTDSTIRIDNYEGLVDVISSQGPNFNVTGLQFPINIIFRNTDTEITINDESSFLNILEQCEFNSIRDEFDEFFNGCFKFEYPVTLLDNNGVETELSSDEMFQSFYQSQGTLYQPNFKFPINLLVGANLETTTIDTYFGFYRIIAFCETRCPQLDFTSELTDMFNLGYRFEADFPEIETIGTYEWFIDGQFIESDGPSVQGDNLLLRDFDAPGTYVVCIKAETPECPEGIEVCKSIVVAESCPNLDFSFEQQQGTLQYTFTASFSGIEELSYEWFVDNEITEEDGGPNGDNVYITELTPGVHQVCIKTTTPSCPNGTEECKEIVVEPICPNLFFSFEQEGNTNGYNFIADFQDIGTINYQWEIDGQIQEQDGGQTGDNMFFFQFDPGSYLVCIRAVTDTCPEGTQFCEEIVVQ